MTQNLESADHAAKLILASAVIISYMLDWVSGPSALVLLVLACVVVLSYILRMVYKWMTMD